MPTDRYYTRVAAAALCGVSVDTIRRRQRARAFPGARQRPDGTWEVPVSDLVAAGLYDPTAAPDQTQRPTTAQALVADLQSRLAAATQHADALAAQLAASQDEVRFLRAALTDALAAREVR